MRKLLLLVLILGGAFWFWSLRRAATLFVVQVRGGEAYLRRGKIPPLLLNDIDDIVQRARTTRAEIRCEVIGGAPAVTFRGDVTGDVAQQVRNVVGRFTVAALRRGRSN